MVQMPCLPVVTARSSSSRSGCLTQLDWFGSRSRRGSEESVPKEGRNAMQSPELACMPVEIKVKTDVVPVSPVQRAGFSRSAVDEDTVAAINAMMCDMEERLWHDR
eukprot:gnl/MRDRNA2_/MRDRNA2_99577_c0_seq1.p1 gnl/MRDRNA2_/MRDRNA2_99577_c0~~gnl/MRDRNA2_/MRDRNA2_99577_c0_seq1.p1  ORF type:complete len:106 (+),score=15.97 gnl/MRDRNA2_/MRDRNA2_99577_c0_seq1:65-382(+)